MVGVGAMFGRRGRDDSSGPLIPIGLIALVLVFPGLIGAIGAGTVLSEVYDQLLAMLYEIPYLADVLIYFFH